jgi:hypothetical protein
LSGITALVARKFTNDKTADGLLEAFYLTAGCVSLGLSQAQVENDLSYLLEHGAEQVFQAGFRAIKELSALPAQTMLTDFDNDAFIQQRDIKALFIAICRANPSMVWTGDDDYRKEMLARRENQTVVECAKWLRKKHFSGPIKDTDLDANAVIAIAVIFAMLNDRRIVARVRQKDIENLIRSARENKPDAELGWGELLKIAPLEYHAILRERMDEFKSKIIKKILSRTSIVKVVTEIQNCYAGSEQEIDYC